MQGETSVFILGVCVRAEFQQQPDDFGTVGICQCFNQDGCPVIILLRRIRAVIQQQPDDFGGGSVVNCQTQRRNPGAVLRVYIRAAFQLGLYGHNGDVALPELLGAQFIAVPGHGSRLGFLRGQWQRRPGRCLLWRGCARQNGGRRHDGPQRGRGR